MNDGITGAVGVALVKAYGLKAWAAGVALVKAYGLKASAGMVGAALLYIVLPPLNPDGSFNKHEFAGRLAVAGMFSIMFGDIAAETVSHYVPWLNAMAHRGTIDLIVGAPGWWISRAIALYFHNRRDRDAAQIINDIKGE